MSLTAPGSSILDVTDEIMFEELVYVAEHELNKDVREKRRWPRPLFQVSGRRYLILQEDVKDRIGRILVPDVYQKKYQVSSGFILQVGDGFDEGDQSPWEPPYGVGDKVAWGKYNDTELEIDVEESWWSEEEIKRLTPDHRKVRFVIVNTHQVLGVLL